jgi:hypothetical protein
MKLPVAGAKDAGMLPSSTETITWMYSGVSSIKQASA